MDGFDHSQGAPAGKFHNPPGLYVATIHDNVAPPATFLSSRKRRLQEEAQQAKNAELARQAQQEPTTQALVRDDE